MNSRRTSDDVMRRCLKLQIARCRAECRSFAPKIAKNADWVLTTDPACGIIIDVAGSNTPGTPHGVCGRSSSGRAPPCQGGGSEFEPRRPLQTNSKEPVYAGFLLIMVTWPSGKARVCKTLIRQFKSARHLQNSRRQVARGSFSAYSPLDFV